MENHKLIGVTPSSFDAAIFMQMPNKQDPPPFVGGTVPTPKPQEAREKVLGMDLTDLQVRHEQLWN